MGGLSGRLARLEDKRQPAEAQRSPGDWDRELAEVEQTLAGPDSPQRRDLIRQMDELQADQPQPWLYR